MRIKLGDIKGWGKIWTDPTEIPLPEEPVDIYDPIYGYVRLEKEEVFILDLPPMQRLRHISQLGLANLVYPGANHTRFEHSIGVCCLVKKVLQSFKQKSIEGLKLDKEICDTAIFSALLHDIGHFPFSHATESLVRDNFKKNHEILSSEIVNTPYMKCAFDVIKDHFDMEVDLKKLAGFIIGKGDSGERFLANLIKGFIDADRMDYLVRDAYYTGVPFGKVDLERLAKTLVPIQDRDNWILAVEEKGRPAVESLIIARSLMHNSVYYHHTKRVAEAMLARATNSTLKPNNEPLLSLTALNDKSLLSKMLSSDISKELTHKIINRELFKRVAEIKVSKVGNEHALKDFSNKKLFDKNKYETKICKTLDLKKGSIILDFPGIPSSKEIDFPVALDRSKFRPLWEDSEIVRAAELQRRKDWTAYVFCSQRTEKIRKGVKKFLNDELGFSLS